MQNDLEIRFVRAHDEYSDAIYRYCYFRVFDREVAYDIVQETFMKTWEYLAAGKQVENLRAFLYKVANNMIIDLSRKKKAMSLEALHESGFDPGHDEREKLRAAVDFDSLLRNLEALDEKYREAVLLRYVEGMSPEEIAGITGESANTVSVRIHRALKQLRIILDKKYDAGRI